MKKCSVYFFSLLIPTYCLAQGVEVHDCNGRWTNLPCDQAAAPANNKKVLTPDEARARSQKETLLHKLRMKSIEADRKYKIDLDMSVVESLCNNVTTSLEICRKESERLEEKLDRKINAAALLKQREEKIEKLKEPAVVQVPQTTVIIRERYPYYRPRPRGGYPYYDGNSPNGYGQQQGGGQQIQQNVIIQQPSTPPPPPAPPKTSMGGDRIFR
jgi:hypothetical protein